MSSSAIVGLQEYNVDNIASCSILGPITNCRPFGSASGVAL